MKTSFYRCRSCGDSILSNTNGILRFCKCGSMGVDGNYSITRIIGKTENVEFVDSLQLKKVYKLKDELTGLYFAGRGSFTREGRVYSKIPQKAWGFPRKCKVESFYLLKEGELNFLTSHK